MLWQNIPIFLIVLPLGLSSVIALMHPRWARNAALSLSTLCMVGAACLLWKINALGGAFTVKLGEVGAPFGNELYVSHTEVLLCLAFDAIMLLSLLAGLKRADEEIPENRRSLFFTVCSLLLAALNAITFTNDIFSGYVFLEIATIAAAALIFVRRGEGALFASMRYMLMNLLGSGLFLLGLSMMYSLTGELLFPQMHERACLILADGRYTGALSACLILLSLGLAVKSALYPFHTWLPNAYSLSTPAASSLLSSLVSKAYIFLFIKIVLRGAGLEAFLQSGAANVILVYAVLAIIIGSVDAIQQHNIRRMVSYSSVAQIGYIFMAAAIGTKEGCAAAVFQILAHSFAKAMLFPAVDRLVEVSGGEENFRDLRGSGYRAPLAGVAFAIGAFSITGIPLLGGFSAKVFISQAAWSAGGIRMYGTLAALAVSTVLNVIYFLRTMITVYRKGERFDLCPMGNRPFSFSLGVGAFALVNLYLGIGAGNVMKVILRGINIWN